jgi:Zn-dependent protease
MSSAPPPYGPPPPDDSSRFDPWQQQPYSPPSQPARQSVQRRGGLVGGLLTLLAAIWAYGKYALVIFKFGAIKTLLSLLVSFGAYAVYFRSWAVAAGLVVMILVHEMGHVIEIRRQGMRASAPLFIPFLGAAIFQRQHPTDALKQAQIGIAGPLAGSVGATVAWVLYGSTHSRALLLWALIGFGLNLFNLIPFGMLDGGWILAVVSKWFQIVGLAALLVWAALLGLPGYLLILVVVLCLPAVIERFRNDRSPYYQAVPIPARYAMGVAWLGLVVYLAFAAYQSYQLLPLVR